MKYKIIMKNGETKLIWDSDECGFVFDSTGFMLCEDYSEGTIKLLVADIAHIKPIYD